MTYVTTAVEALDVGRVFHGAFMAELREWDPTLASYLRFAYPVSRDAVDIKLGHSHVTVTGLELIQTPPAALTILAKRKARELLDHYTEPDRSDYKLERSLAGLEHARVVPAATPLLDRFA